MYMYVLSFYLSNGYIGQKLRENGFDPKGKGASTMLDDLVSKLLILFIILF